MTNCQINIIVTMFKNNSKFLKSKYILRKKKRSQASSYRLVARWDDWDYGWTSVNIKPEKHIRKKIRIINIIYM